MIYHAGSLQLSLSCRAATDCDHCLAQAPSGRCTCTLLWTLASNLGVLSQERGTGTDLVLVQAYQVLKRGGLDDDHIVVMHADDLAHDIQNPHSGADLTSKSAGFP